MEATLQALGGILLKAIPTLILVLFVHLYLKYVFFRPLEGVLQKRREATEGAKESAQASLARAAEKTAQYEAALREARSGVYKEMEETRRRWLGDQAARIEEARLKSQAQMKAARAQLDLDTVAARTELAASSQPLGEQIATALLERRAS